MEKELVKLFESAKKAADAAAVDIKAVSSPEEDRCLDALNRLKKFPVSYDVLVSTQVIFLFYLFIFYLLFSFMFVGGLKECIGKIWPRGRGWDWIGLHSQKS